jgi:hypothetical protein
MEDHIMAWGKAEHKAGRFLKELDADDVYDQLDTMRDYLKELTGAFGKIAGRQLSQARHFASDTAHDAEETMKDNLGASLVLAVGLGVLVGYMIRRGTE